MSVLVVTGDDTVLAGMCAGAGIDGGGGFMSVLVLGEERMNNSDVIVWSDVVVCASKHVT